MPFFIAHRDRPPRRLASPATTATVDVTRRAPEPWVRLSPFYPHGGIPVPFTAHRTAGSVEGIWQALMVFEHADVDPTRLGHDRRGPIARASRALGPMKGHRAGLEHGVILDRVEARFAILLPSYRYVLEHRVRTEVALLRAMAADGRTVVLLDDATGDDPLDPTRPLSFAALIVRWIEGRWPPAAANDNARAPAVLAPLREGWRGH